LSAMSGATFFGCLTQWFLQMPNPPIVALVVWW
jgi:hypothetical protein